MTGHITGKSPVRRVFILLLIIFVLIISACVFYLLPELASNRRMTAAADDAATGINAQMNDIAAREARQQADRSKFEMLEKEGFLGPQNRLDAARILEKLRVQHRIAGLEYQIEPVQALSILRQPENTGVVMSISKITLSLRGFLDGDLHDFIEALKRGLPGHVTVTGMEMEKTAPLSDELLADISRGGGSGLVRGAVELQWQVAQPAYENPGL